MKKYDHKQIEKKWQEEWAKSRIYEADDKSQKKKFYPLVEFPFPSGSGLHTGHIRSYTAMDVVARKHRMQGENVLYPIGWDAFGLPTENYAIQTGKQPKLVTRENTDNFRKQLKSLGLSFDWSREINTTDPEYFKWTQWIFLKMYERGLAYKAKSVINWCPKDKIGLANEEVVNGKCDRCGSTVEKREKEQWMLAITKYADRLYDDLDTVDYLERIKTQQRNWIGRSEGAELDFAVKGTAEKIKVFTTRPDTLFGVTYVVLAPEHELVSKLKLKNEREIRAYIKSAKKKNDIERTDAKKEKTGMKLDGVFAINPANREEISIFVADYVLADYGTGAVMAVPAHDERDWEFAKK
ncbi:MAG TPA: class I tRNA ligase family protein, partial [Candidatus Paceibacterota bacterium]